MPSSIWNAQPDSEKSKINKICAGCESEPATLVCGKCHCTRYCKKECQIKHWKKHHKKQCLPDPLYFMKEGDSFPLPNYRKYSAAEKESHNLVYTLQPGQLDRPPTDYRDELCTLITPTEQRVVDMLVSLGTSHGQKRRFEMEMGWSLTSTELVVGYSNEDNVVYRLLFDDNFLNRPEMPENLIAHIVMNSSPCRGKFLVVKCPAFDRDGENPYAKLISFPKSELVDIMAWRAFIGSHRYVSSRVFRENMRKREMKSFLDEMGV